MKDDFTLWTVDDEEVVTSGICLEVLQGIYVSFNYFMTITNPNKKDFLKRYSFRYGYDSLMNIVSVGIYSTSDGAVAV